MDFSVQDDVEHDDPGILYQVIDAVVVCQDAENVSRNGVESGLAGVRRHGVPAEGPDAPEHFILGFFGTNEGRALQLLDDAFHGGDGTVGDDDIPVHARKMVNRWQNRG